MEEMLHCVFSSTHSLALSFASLLAPVLLETMSWSLSFLNRIFSRNVSSSPCCFK